MRHSHTVIAAVVGTLVVLAIVNRVAFLAPVSGVVKTVTG